MDKIISKIITSSQDPTKISLTVKGFLLAFVPFFMVVSGLTEAELGETIDVIAQVVFLVTSLIALIPTVIGLFRKLKNGRWAHPDA